MPGRAASAAGGPMGKVRSRHCRVKADGDRVSPQLFKSFLALSACKVPRAETCYTAQGPPGDRREATVTETGGRSSSLRRARLEPAASYEAGKGTPRAGAAGVGSPPEPRAESPSPGRPPATCHSPVRPSLLPCPPAASCSSVHHPLFPLPLCPRPRSAPPCRTTTSWKAGTRPRASLCRPSHSTRGSVGACQAPAPASLHSLRVSPVLPTQCQAISCVAALSLSHCELAPPHPIASI